jgi:cytochrome c-type biogenesis protein
VIDNFAHYLDSILKGAPHWALALVFLGGVLTSLGPCNLSMIPVIIGYVGGQKDLTRRRGFWLSCCFTLGSSITFVILGVIAATVGMFVGNGRLLLQWLAAILCIIIGLIMLGALHINLDFMTRLQPKRIAVQGLLGAFLLGMIMGMAGSQCGTPVLFAILGYVLAKGTLAYGAVLLFAYGLGRGVPVIVAGTFTGVVNAMPHIARWTGWMQKAAGVVLILVGLYFVWTLA